MPFDTLTMAAAVHDCKQLAGSKLTKIHQPDRFSVLLRCYGPQGNCKLLLSAHPVDGRIQLTDRTYDNPAKPPLFCMVLRKHLDGARLTNIVQLPGERVVQMDFAAHDEIGQPTNRRLMLEVMGKHSNLILLDADTNLIIDAARRYTHMVSRYREVLPGVPYLPPPPSDKPLWSALTAEQLAEALLNSDLQQSPARLLQTNVAGLSPYLCRKICALCGLADWANSEELGEYELTRLHEQLQKLAAIIENGGFQPVLLGQKHAWQDFYALPPEDAQPHQQFATMSEALDAFYQRRQDRQAFTGEHSHLYKLLTREQQRLTKKIKLEEADYADAVEADKYKNAGDLLMAYLHMIKPGQTEIALPDFYEPEKEVKIHLKPELSAVDNAKRYFHRYNKAKKTERQIKQQLDANRSELEYVESLLVALAEAENTADLLATAQEMQDAGYLKRQQNQPKAKSAARKEPEKFRTSDGFTVLLGRNNRQNDRLTGKIADKEDLWFHTQKIPGSHVILRREPNRDFSDTALAEAAALAARHSQAREADKVPVDYTAVKNVKKPNGAKPGMVIYFEQQTLYVTPKDLQPIETANETANENGTD